jgi:hypothetical protein
MRRVAAESAGKTGYGYRRREGAGAIYLRVRRRSGRGLKEKRMYNLKVEIL